MKIYRIWAALGRTGAPATTRPDAGHALLLYDPDPFAQAHVALDAQLASLLARLASLEGRDGTLGAIDSRFLPIDGSIVEGPEPSDSTDSDGMNLDLPPLGSNGDPQAHLTLDQEATLRAWFNEHLEHPYPTFSDESVWGAGTRLDPRVVRDWFVTARFRQWHALQNSDPVSPCAANLNAPVIDPPLAAEERGTPETWDRSTTLQTSSRSQPKGRYWEFPAEVTEILDGWVMRHLLLPYPDTEQKRMLQEATGLNNRQLTWWMTNFRTRKWVGRMVENPDQLTMLERELKKPDEERFKSLHSYAVQLMVRVAADARREFDLRSGLDGSQDSPTSQSSSSSSSRSFGSREVGRHRASRVSHPPSSVSKGTGISRTTVDLNHVLTVDGRALESHLDLCDPSVLGTCCLVSAHAEDGHGRPKDHFLMVLDVAEPGAETPLVLASKYSRHDSDRTFTCPRWIRPDLAIMHEAGPSSLGGQLRLVSFRSGGDPNRALRLGSALPGLHQGPTLDLAVDPATQTRIVSSGRGNDLAVVDLNRPQIVSRLQGWSGDGVLHSVRWSPWQPHGPSITLVHQPVGTLRGWDPVRRRETRESARGNALRIFDLRQNRQPAWDISLLSGENATSHDFYLENKVIVAFEGGELWTLDLRFPGRPLHEVQAPGIGTVDSLECDSLTNLMVMSGYGVSSLWKLDEKTGEPSWLRDIDGSGGHGVDAAHVPVLVPGRGDLLIDCSSEGEYSRINLAADSCP